MATKIDEKTYEGILKARERGYSPERITAYLKLRGIPVEPYERALAGLPYEPPVLPLPPVTVPEPTVIAPEPVVKLPPAKLPTKLLEPVWTPPGVPEIKKEPGIWARDVYEKVVGPLVKLTPEEEHKLSEKYRVWSERAFIEKYPRAYKAKAGERSVMFMATGMAAGALVPSVLGAIAKVIPAFGHWALRHKYLAPLLSRSIEGSIAGLTTKEPMTPATQAAIQGAAASTVWSVIYGLVPPVFRALLRKPEIHRRIAAEIPALPAPRPAVPPPKPPILPKPAEIVKPVTPPVPVAPPAVTPEIVPPTPPPPEVPPVPTPLEPVLLPPKPVPAPPPPEAPKKGYIAVFPTGKKNVLNQIIQAIKDAPGNILIRRYLTSEEALQRVGLVRKDLFKDPTELDPPTVEFNIDGRFKITNDKEALLTFYELVRRTPEFIRLTPVEKRIGVPRPTVKSRQKLIEEFQKEIDSIDEKIRHYQTKIERIAEEEIYDFDFTDLGLDKETIPPEQVIPTLTAKIESLISNLQRQKDVLVHNVGELQKLLTPTNEAYEETLDKIDELQKKIPIKSLYPIDILPEHEAFAKNVVNVDPDELIRFAGMVAEQLRIPIIESKKKLTPRVLGMFRYIRDKIAREGKPPAEIEVRLLEEPQVLLHEIGHAVMTLYTPDGGKSLFDKYREEAVKVHAMYTAFYRIPRRRGTRRVEIMADYFAGYILAPDETVRLAPNLTAEFETILKQNKLDGLFNRDVLKTQLLVRPETIINRLQETTEVMVSNLTGMPLNMCRYLYHTMWDILNAILPTQAIALTGRYPNLTELYFANEEVYFDTAEVPNKMLETLNIKDTRRILADSVLRRALEQALRRTYIYKYWAPDIESLVKTLKIPKEEATAIFPVYKRISDIYSRARNLIAETTAELYGMLLEEVLARLPTFYINTQRVGRIKLYAEVEAPLGKFTDIYFEGFDTDVEAIRQAVALQRLGYKNVRVYNLPGDAFYVVLIDERGKITEIKKFRTAERAERYRATIPVRTVIIEGTVGVAPLMKTLLRGGRWKAMSVEQILTILNTHGVNYNSPDVQRLLSELKRFKYPKFLIQKKYVPGVRFDAEEFLTNLAGYIADLHNWRYKLKVKENFDKIIQKVESAEEMEYINRYIDALYGMPSDTTAIVSSFLAVKYLGLKVPFMIAEILQPAIAQVPMSIRYLGAAGATKINTLGLLDIVRFWTGVGKDKIPKDILAVLERGKDAGIFIESLREQLRVVTRRSIRENLLKRKLTAYFADKTTDFFLGYIGLLEQYLRSYGLATGVRLFKELQARNITPTIAGKPFTDMYDFALAFTEMVNVDYNRQVNPIFLQKKLGEALPQELISAPFLFWRFISTMNTLYLRNILVSTRKEAGEIPFFSDKFRRLLFIITGLLTAGIASIPFGRRIIEDAYRKKHKRSLYHDLRGTSYYPFTKYLYWGIPSLTTGADFRYSLSADMEYRFRTALDFIFGPLAGMERSVRIADRFRQRGDYWEGIFNIVAPVSLINTYYGIQALRHYDETGRLVLRERAYPIEDITFTERVNLIAGFKPLRIAEVQIAYEFARDYTRAKIRSLKQFYDKFADDLRERTILVERYEKKFGPPRTEEELYTAVPRVREIDEENRKSIQRIVKEYGIMPRMEVIFKKLERTEIFDERIKLFPKEIRGYLRQIGATIREEDETKKIKDRIVNELLTEVKTNNLAISVFEIRKTVDEVYKEMLE